MAWDFSTEPEFEEHLEWMREFVREEIWPLETIVDEFGEEGFDRAMAPLKERVKERGLWAAHLPARAGRAGLRTGQARADARDHRHARSRRTRSATARRTPATPRSWRWPGRDDQKER